MPHHHSAARPSHPLALLTFAGTALGSVVGAVGFSPTASAAATSGLTLTAANCDRQVSPDHLDSALAHAALGEVVCVPGEHSAHPASHQSFTGSASAPRTVQPRVAPSGSEDIGGHREKRHAETSHARPRHHLEEYTVSDLLEHTLGPYL